MAFSLAPLDQSKDAGVRSNTSRQIGSKQMSNLLAYDFPVNLFGFWWPWQTVRPFKKMEDIVLIN